MAVELAVELRRLEKDRVTGMLRTSDGVFHLAEGAIASVDCRRTIGLDRLVVEAGVATMEDWRRAAAGDPGHMLGRPRLETLALLSVFDAAYFLLASPSVPEFRPAPPHWLAQICQITPRALVHECARRGDPESGPWPAELVDRAPVVPVRRVRRRRVVLTGGQAEVLAAADTRRSITEIARDLGRTTYGCLEAVRELTAAGLIEPPVAAPIPVATAEPVAAVRAVGESGPLPRRASRRSEPLPRRAPRRSEPVPDSDSWEPVDEALLLRLRAALEELA
ncbi:hypothetical protein KO481_27530 [Nocardia sp. NEAU-G5]|uniref:MarR family transcriptional regulator n=1 Tax=Nocardia albiluteola TaxID=2842303 RepID=A0ABS6B4N2_9NOCA|nr:hypothetical protein [Nocardia albiluteola]MBU3065267.1 hypothetical protein [Nocardia albiluteola]